MSAPRVGEALARLAVFAADDFSVDEMLRRLGEVAAATLSVDGVGVMGTSSGVGDRTRFVYASDPLLEPMEFLQEANQSGPCQESAATMTTVVCATDSGLDRWPEFAGAARLAGVRAAVSAPLISRGSCWGVLDLFWLSDTTLDQAILAEVELLAKVAVSYLVIADDRYRADVAQRQLAARLLHDPMTGLANRELIHELTYHALVNAHRRGRSVALLFIDLDQFKAVNDTRGHRAGDTVLATVAQRMREAVRASDTVSRLSGDEFLILCEDLTGDTTDTDGAAAGAAAGIDSVLTVLAERVLTAIGAPITVDAGPPIVMAASIGIALTNTQPAVADLIHDADQAMYQAKQHHQQRVVIHRQQHLAGETDRRALERQLFGALERGEMRLHYQPVIDVTNDHVAAVEALLRWEHPQLGLLPASRFIDLATSNGTIVRTGHWAVGEALSQMRRWQDTDPDGAPATVFVNFSPQQLIDHELGSVISTGLQEAGLPASALGMEITENALDDVRVRPCAAHYQQLGHPLAIDDFGTGYSSLAWLVELPVSYLKLDLSLVTRLPGDPQARTLLQAILVIADTMTLTVIGEGVQDHTQATYLAEKGCTLQQGFHHGRPTTGDDLTARLLHVPTPLSPQMVPPPRPPTDTIDSPAAGPGPEHVGPVSGQPRAKPEGDFGQKA